LEELVDEFVARSCAIAGIETNAAPATKVEASATAIFEVVFIFILSVWDSSEAIQFSKAELEKPASVDEAASSLSVMRVVWELSVRENASALVPSRT
jgi:hypothetical protein